MIEVTSINGHVKSPHGSKPVSVNGQGQWLVLSYRDNLLAAKDCPICKSTDSIVHRGECSLCTSCMMVYPFTKFTDVFYNQDGREVFKVIHSKEKPCSFKSSVVSAITRLVGRGKTSTPRT